MSFALPFSVRARSLVLAGAMLLTTVAAPLVASAHFMGWPNGHWVRPGTWGLHLNYSRGCTGGFWTAAGEAGHNWTATPTPVYYDEVGSPPCTGGWYTGYTDLYSFNDPAAWYWGWANVAATHTICDTYFWPFGCISSHQALVPSSWGETYTSGQIMLNTAKITGSNYFLLVGDVTHEMGHILGLAHSGYYNGEASGYYSIMDYLNWSYNKPLAHDYADTNALYP